VLGIEATGTVLGFVYFDANGTRELDQGDEGQDGIRVRLVAMGSNVPIAAERSDEDGLFSLTDVPVGSYEVTVDDESIADTVEVVEIDDDEVTIAPDDSLRVTVAVSFPIVTVAEARALPIDKRVFVQGIVLNGRSTFGDNTVHLSDTSGFIRATRVRAATLFPGDSVRFRGTMRTLDGQPTLDDVTSFILAISEEPDPTEVGTAVAASADGGLLDAALVSIADATVADTATVDDDFHVTVDDGSGVLVVVLDEDVGFDLTPYEPASVVSVTGLLVPADQDIWVLKPRGGRDIEVISTP
jgi:hypothetical protein